MNIYLFIVCFKRLMNRSVTSWTHLINICISNKQPSNKLQILICDCVEKCRVSLSIHTSDVLLIKHVPSILNRNESILLRCFEKFHLLQEKYRWPLFYLSHSFHLFFHVILFLFSGNRSLFWLIYCCFLWTFNPNQRRRNDFALDILILRFENPRNLIFIF